MSSYDSRTPPQIRIDETIKKYEGRLRSLEPTIYDDMNDKYLYNQLKSCYNDLVDIKTLLDKHTKGD